MIDEEAPRGLDAEPRFAPTPESVRAVRRLVADALDDVEPTTVEIAELVASELATNAVIHARTPFSVKIYATETVVRLDVTDEGGGHPAVRPADSGGGRGLRIVEEVASRWGVRHEGDETVVWVELDR